MPALLEAADTLNPDSEGGCVLLGVDGICVIAHGSSNARAIAQLGARRAECVQARGRRSHEGSSRRCRLRRTSSAPDRTATTCSGSSASGSPRSSRSTRTAITMDSDFAADLDADSLALIELVEALEEELGERTVGFSIDDEDLGDLKTVRDAVDYVIHRLERGHRRDQDGDGRDAARRGRCRRPGTRRAAPARAGLDLRRPRPPRPCAHPPLVLRGARHRGVERTPRVPRRLRARSRRHRTSSTRSTRSSPRASSRSCGRRS